MSRQRLLVGAGLGLVALLAPMAVTSPPLLVWNASASAPIGLYLVRPMPHPVRGVLAVIRPPAALARFADARGYLPLGAPMLKPIAALAGQTICRRGELIRIEDRVVGRALAHDRLGRALPVWQGCRQLAGDELFVMNRAVREGFDGRYFGPLNSAAVLGRARPLWISTPLPLPRSKSHEPDWRVYPHRRGL